MYFINLLYISLLTYFSPVDSNTVSIEKIRADYSQYATNKSLCERALKSLSENKNKDAVQLGYYGALQAIWANHTANPLNKINSFIKGKKSIEKAIISDNDNIELRFIRLSIQLNVPYFLNYRSNIEEDKLFILKRRNELKSYSLHKHLDAMLKD